MPSRQFRAYSSSMSRKRRRKTLHQRWDLRGHLITKKDGWGASLAQVERVHSVLDSPWVTITFSTTCTSCRILHNCSRQMTSTQLFPQLLPSSPVEAFRILRSL